MEGPNQGPEPPAFPAFQNWEFGGNGSPDWLDLLAILKFAPAVPAVPVAIIPAILDDPQMLALQNGAVMLAILDGAVENNAVEDMVVIMHGLDINEDDSDDMYEAYDEDIN